MVFNTTYTEREDIRAMNALVGEPFSLMKRIKMGGVGSSRLMILQVSEHFKSLLNQVSDINYINIELRPKGVIVHLTQRLKRFAWAIPYYKLVVFNTSHFSIHADGNFIRVAKNKQHAINKKFLRKMMNLKINAHEDYEFLFYEGS
ncbi:Arginyl-tRNA synthetase [Tenacibaculum litopenaei]|uniref:hypothetical protein n=1 Tax=Tenacibaculum litopenaei TaxID=396016 RepID=UPI003895561A